jgi:hypothetical protein
MAIQNTASTSDISALSQRVQNLGHAAKLANNLYLVLLAGTLIASVFIVVLNNKRADAQEKLAETKDTQRARDSQEKDRQIAEANKASGEANERAAKLEKESTEAQLQLLKLRRSMTEPRTVDAEKAKAVLEKAKGSVEIRYLDGVETEWCALELQKCLAANGWTVSIKKVGREVFSYTGISLDTGSKTLLDTQTRSGFHGFFEEPGDTLYEFVHTW